MWNKTLKSVFFQSFRSERIPGPFIWSKKHLDSIVKTFVALSAHRKLFGFVNRKTIIIVVKFYQIQCESDNAFINSKFSDTDEDV